MNTEAASEDPGQRGRLALAAALLIALLLGAWAVLGPDAPEGEGAAQATPAKTSEESPHEPEGSGASGSPRPSATPSTQGGGEGAAPEDPHGLAERPRVIVKRPAPPDPEGPPLAQVRVRVVDTEGRGVVGASVAVDNNPLGVWSGTTGANGEVTVAVPPNLFVVRANVGRGESFRSGRVYVRALSGKTTEITVPLDTFVRLTVLLDREVTHHEAYLVGTRRGQRVVGVEPDEPQRLRSLSFNPLVRREKAGARRIRFGEPLRPDRYRLVVFARVEGALWGAVREVTVSGAPRQEVSVGLKPLGSVEGVLRDASGQGVAGSVWLRRTEEYLRFGRDAEIPKLSFVGDDDDEGEADAAREAFLEEGRLETDAEGRFTIPAVLPPGTWRLVGMADDATSAAASADFVVPAAPSKPQQIVLTLRESVALRLALGGRKLEGGELRAHGPPGLRLRAREDGDYDLLGLAANEEAWVFWEASAFERSGKDMGFARIQGGARTARLLFGKPPEVSLQVFTRDSLGAEGMMVLYRPKHFDAPWATTLDLEDPDQPEAGFAGGGTLLLHSGGTTESAWTDEKGATGPVSLTPGAWSFWVPGGERHTLELELGQSHSLTFDAGAGK